MDSPDTRTTLLARVIARVLQAQEEGSPDLLREKDASADAAALLGSVPDLAADPEVGLVAGWFYWMRYLGDHDNQQDLATALTCFSTIHETHPDAGPEEVRILLDKNRRVSRDEEWKGTDVLLQGNRGGVLLRRSLRTDDEAALTQAVGLLERAVNAVPSWYFPYSGWRRQLALALRVRFERAGDPADLERAIDLGRDIVAKLPADDPDRGGYLTNHGIALRLRFEHSGHRADLDSALTVCREAVAASPPGSPTRPLALSNLGNALHVRFELDGDPRDLDAAIDHSQEALRASAADEPDRTHWFTNLGIALGARYHLASDPDDLDAAIDAERAAVAAVRLGHPDRPAKLSNLSVSLSTRFVERRDPRDLDAAVDAAREAAATISADLSEHAAVLARARARLSEVLRHEGRDDDLLLITEAPTGTASPSPASAPPGEDEGGRPRDPGDVPPPEFPWAVRRLADRIQRSFASWRRRLRVGDLHAEGPIDEALRAVRSGDTADRDGAIDLLRGWLADGPDNHPDRTLAVAMSTILLIMRGSQTGVLPDLDEAVRVGRRAADDLVDEDQTATLLLMNLGLALRSRFEQTDVLSDLDDAVDVGRRAVRVAAAADPYLPLARGILTDTLRTRFGRTWNLADRDEAVRVARQGVAASLDDGIDRAVGLATLGAVLAMGFERTGALADLDEAIELERQALALLSEETTTRPVVATNLGHALRIRFDHTYRMADIDEAVEVGHLAVTWTPAGDPGLAARASNLGNALLARYRRTRLQADLDEAVRLGRLALSGTPPALPERATHEADLANTLHAQFKRTGRREHLDEAIAIGRRAVNATPQSHPRHAMYLSNLSVALSTRFRAAQDPADLEEAVHTARRAVTATPDDDPYQSRYISNLGLALTSSFESMQRLPDLEEALAVCRRGAAATRSSPVSRIGAAVGWGRAAAADGRWSEAIDGYTAAIGLLARASPRGLGRTDQEGVLANLPGLGTEAAACCVQAGDLDRAVELFEQGRAILLGQALDTRTDLTTLTDSHPDLARRFLALRDALDTPNGMVPPVAYEGAAGQPVPARRTANDRDETAAAFEDLIAEIRSADGFEGFLAAPSITDLRRAAAGGPVVLVNVAPLRSDALIITPDEVRGPIPLRQAGPDEVQAQVDEFLGALQDVNTPAVSEKIYLAAQQRMTAVLAWLWEAIAEPVMRSLDLAGAPSAAEAAESGEHPRTRVWWCPSGPLSFLPLHAAGGGAQHGDGSASTVADQAVSSYTPTLRALIHARRPPAPAGPASRPRTGTAARIPGPIVAIAMAHTPGLPPSFDLPGASAEAALLADHFPERTVLLRDEQATHANVIEALREARWAHFSCHAQSSLDKPSESRLLLSDWKHEPLTVLDITRLRLDRAGLAFLSACSTAQGGLRLWDEAIHLGAAFHLAGFQQVIATLGPVEDRTAEAVARDFYEVLRTDGTTDRAAFALHDAMLRQRASTASTPSEWATYIHIGP